MAGPVTLKHICIPCDNIRVFWHVTLIKINYYYYYYYRCVMVSKCNML